MCTIPPIPGWNGLVVEPPSADMVGLWFLLLAPLVLPPLSYLARPLLELQDMLALPPFRMGPVSYKPPTRRWYAVQTAVLSIAFTTLVFVIFPSDRLRRAWFDQAQTTAQPECQPALDAINTAYGNNGGWVFLLGVMAPLFIFIVSTLVATYAREHPHR